MLSGADALKRAQKKKAPRPAPKSSHLKVWAL